MKKLMILLLCTLLSGPALAAEQEKVLLTSLDWPPYTGADLKDQGASVAVAKAAFAAMGYELVVEFYPWRRAVQLAKNNPRYDGYFPEYYDQDYEADFIFSEAMGSGPLGFAERKDKPITWNSLDDLRDISIGVVSDYVNTAEFDARMNDGRLKTSAAGSDLINLQKLSGGRIDLAVIDQHVLNYLLNTAPELKPIRDKIQFNGRLLEDKKLYICFKRGPRGEKLAEIFKQGLARIDVQAIMEQYMNGN